MAQSKMKFGIDLGTTNSAICKMESGEPVIKKTDTLKDTLPSCVSFIKKENCKSWRQCLQRPPTRQITCYEKMV